MASKVKRWIGKSMAKETLITIKYRMQEARIGSFFALDPLAVDYPWNSSKFFWF